jgi:hypothetical protein
MTKILTKPLKRVPFFTIGDGEDAVEFTIAEKVPRSVALQILEEIRRVGYEAVLPVMFEKCLGADAYRVFLERADEIEDTDYDWIQSEVEAKVMGVVESLGEARDAGSNRSAGSSTTKRT